MNFNRLNLPHLVANRFYSFQKCVQATLNIGKGEMNSLAFQCTIIATLDFAKRILAITLKT